MYFIHGLLVNNFTRNGLHNVLLDMNVESLSLLINVMVLDVSHVTVGDSWHGTSITQLP
jgi:hypothetical protein